MGFDPQPILRDGDLVLRPLVAGDRAGLRAAASDPKIWEQHPAKARWRAEVFAPYFDFLLSTEQTLAFELAGQIIGCSRFYPVPNEPGDWGIGFTFLTRAHWGGQMNGRIKALMIDHLLAARRRAFFHIGPDNIRSQKATAKLGASWIYDCELDLGNGPAAYKTYVIEQPHD